MTKQRYAVACGMIVTCNEDGSIPLNSQVLASIGPKYNVIECQKMLDRANAAHDPGGRFDEIARLHEVNAELVKALTAIESQAINLTAPAKPVRDRAIHDIKRWAIAALAKAGEK